MNQYPFIKYSIAFSLGIFLQHFILLNINLITVYIIIFSVTLIYSVIKKYSENFITTLTLSVFLLFGLLAYQISSLKTYKYPFKDYKINNAEIYGVVSDVNLIKEKKLSFEVKLDSIKNISYDKNKSYKFLCNVYDSQKSIIETYNKLKIGNEIYIDGTIIRPRNMRNPYEFDYEKYLNEKGIVFIANVYNTNDIKIINNLYSLFPNIIFEIRKHLDNQLKLLYNKTTYNLLRGLLLADRSEIDDQVNEDFINVGVIHILAVSGLHVGFIVIIFMFLFTRFNLYIKTIFTIIGLLIFMLLTGAGAPVVRATLMTSIVLLLPLFGRSSNGLNSLFVASFILLLINPRDLFNPSFQLSFSAILSLIIIAPKINSTISKLNINKFIKYFILFIGTTISAQIGTLPFTIAYFSKISLVSIIANLIVIPLTGIIVGLGISSLIISIISYQIAFYYASYNELLTYIMLYFIKYLSSFNFSSINIKPFSLYVGILFYISIGLLLSLIKYFNNNIKKIFFVSIVLLLFFIYEKIDNVSLLQDNKLSILAIDVGQGDSFLIKFPNKQTALIDAGNANLNFDNGKKIIIPLLNKLGINKIDYAFVSHVDADHFMGFLSLIKIGMIKKIYKPALIKDEKKDLLFENFIRKNGIDINYYKKEKIKIGNSVIYVLNNNRLNNLSISNNDKSGILKLVYGKNSFLFTGDLGINMEKEYIKDYNNFLESNVLKAGHHGSKTSSNEKFIKTISPKYSLISAGIGNKFKHPHKEVVQRFQNNGTKVLRTDLSGAILICSDGQNLTITDWKKLIY